MNNKDMMPEPLTVNYDQMLKLSQQFVDDAIAILHQLPYVEVHDMVDTIMDSGYVLPVAVTNEIIQRISRNPYHMVKDFMHNVETNQRIYFTAYNPDKNNQQTAAPAEDLKSETVIESSEEIIDKD